jgi:AbrB family looped-hinge helix DNA binding protein
MGVTRSVKVGPKGRVVIPAWARDELGIAEGDELCVIVEGSGVRLMSRDAVLDELQAMFADHPGSMVAELLAERRAEAARDAAEA